MKKHKLLLTLLPGLLFTSLTQAQPSALTLDEAVELAAARTPQMQAQTAAIDMAQAESIAAGRLPDPELVVGVDNLPSSGDDAWSFDRDFMTMRKVGVMQAFPNGRKRAAQRERAAAAVSVAQTEAQRTQLEVARATAEAWIASHSAELLLERLQALKPKVELQAEAARAALSAGKGTTADALAAQSAVKELDDRIINAEREVQVARAELARWVGEDAQRELAAAPAFAELPASRERLLTSFHRHAPLLTYEAQLALARSEIDVARAQKRSDWSAELTYAKRGSAFSDMVSLEFRVGLPLFSRYRQDPMIRAKRAELSKLEADRDTELRTHTAEITAMLAAWDAARKRIGLYEADRLPLARQRSQAALAAFQAGRMELTGVLASHVAEIEVQQEYVELMQQLALAWAYLRYLEPGKDLS
ncbi:MAG TPA: TolC family protein [Steroidobacteraceae bacterium]|nr:TolC family protein [Steroidobacteraceae bacterium]